jgi:hypothetical protein
VVVKQFVQRLTLELEDAVEEEGGAEETGAGIETEPDGVVV